MIELSRETMEKLHGELLGQLMGRVTTFVDLDGVLVDFFKGACDLHLVEEYPRSEWDMAGVIGISEEEFEHGMDREWWAGLSKTPYADTVMGTVMNPIFLTSHMHGACVDGKQDWCEKNYPGIPLIFTKFKRYIGGARRILIDDKEENVTGWREHGGLAVLMPGVGNSRHAEDPLVFVDEYNLLLGGLE